MSLKRLRDYPAGRSPRLAQSNPIRDDVAYGVSLLRNYRRRVSKAQKVCDLNPFSVDSLSPPISLVPSIKDLYFEGIANPFDLLSKSIVLPIVSSSPLDILQHTESGIEVIDFSTAPHEHIVGSVHRELPLYSVLNSEDLLLFSANEILFEKLKEQSWVDKLKAVSESTSIKTIRCGEQLDTEFLREPVLLLEEPHCFCAL